MLDLRTFYNRIVNRLVTLYPREQTPEATRAHRVLSWSNCIQTYETFGVIKKNLIYLIVVTIIITTGATIISVNVAFTTSRCIRPVCCYLSCQPKGPIPSGNL